MQTLYWNLDTRAVSTERYTQSDPAIESTRGDEAVQVILLQGGAPVLLDADGVVGIVVRPASNPKQGCLAGPTALTRGANGAAGYTGETSTDSELTREVMHVDGADPAAELPTFAAEAVFYFAPAGDADPYESLPFPVTILPDYYRPGQLPATSAEDYPPAEQVDTITARNTAIEAAVAAIPASSLPSSLTGLVYSTAGAPSAGTGAQVSTVLYGASDVALTRTAAATLALGNGTAGDASGELHAVTVKSTVGDRLNLDGTTYVVFNVGGYQVGVYRSTSLSIAGNFAVTGSISSDNGHVSTDGAGNVTAISYTGDVSNCTGNAPNLIVGAAETAASADSAGYADTANLAYYASQSNGTDAAYFFGVQPLSVTDASDLPSAITAINAVLSKLQDLHLRS